MITFDIIFVKCRWNMMKNGMGYNFALDKNFDCVLCFYVSYFFSFCLLSKWKHIFLYQINQN